MVDHENHSNLPPIPDGGLAETMPEWLRRPPAWRTLPDREVVAPQPDEATELPEPDDSVIDPRTFLTDDDLPLWLRNLGPGRRRNAAVAGEPDAGTDEPEPVSSGRETFGSDERATKVRASAPSRFVPTAPPPPPGDSTPPVQTATGSSTNLARSETAPAPAWQGAWVVAVLAALLAVAIALIVVLVIA
jgi:hypothetical protein